MRIAAGRSWAANELWVVLDSGARACVGAEPPPPMLQRAPDAVRSVREILAVEQEIIVIDIERCCLLPTHLVSPDTDKFFPISRSSLV
jgi:hypothetical protein